ncbi:MAG: peptidyl-prolyl cis-trans isomerase [Cyclobacteriaceae bacterium]|nr:MAG: peptidyl-prolyl cis-trans isomerase [Cyclobacteriaceae bacterium]
MKAKYNVLIAVVLLLSLALSCASKKDYLVTIKTSYGDISLILFDDTPLHKNNFLELARQGRYDGTTFYRVIKEFMIQGGDVNKKEGTKVSTDAMIPEEIKPHHFHVRGAVAAARTSNPQRKSSECQFYIVQGRTWTEEELTLDEAKLHQYLRELLQKPEHQDLRQEFIELQQTGDATAIQSKLKALQPVIEEEFNVTLTKAVPVDRIQAYTTKGGTPHLDDEYTVFGQVLSGMEVVDAIANQVTDGMDKPEEDISMVIEVEEMRRAKITKQYGYKYP